MKKRHFIASILVGLMVAINLVLAESISTITEDVTTEFGTYQPETVTVTPSVTPYNIENDLSNIINIGDFELGYEAKDLLSTNGFVSEASPYRQIYDVYNECKDRGIPIFVTTDLFAMIKLLSCRDRHFCMIAIIGCTKSIFSKNSLTIFNS